MLLRFYCKALFIVWLASIYLSQNTFKVCINNIWHFHLLVVVFEGHLGFSHFWHLRSGWAFQQPFAFWLVPFKQVSSFISVQAAFAKMFAFIVPVLVIKVLGAFSHSCNACFLLALLSLS